MARELLKINPAITAIRILGYSAGKGHFKYWGKGELEIYNIPDNQHLQILGNTGNCPSGKVCKVKKYLALRKDGLLYKL